MVSWLVIASGLAVLGAVAATVLSWQVSVELPDPDRGGIAINVAALATALLISIGTGVALPSWWRRIVSVVALLPMLVFVIMSGNSQAGFVAAAVLLPAAWLGRKYAALLLGQLDRLTLWLIGAAFGFGLIAAIGFGLGSLGLLRPAIIWPLFLGLTSMLILTDRQALFHDLRMVVAWLRQPSRGNAMTLLLTGIFLALLWYNVIGALSPETASDTVRQRLTTASYFAQTRHLAVDNAELYTSQTPAAGEIADAVLIAIGPLQTVNLLTFLQGVLCMLTILAIGRSLQDTQAGLIAGFTFYAMPLVSWLSQTAYLDLLTTLFALSVVLIIVSKKQFSWRVTTAIGIISGLGLSVKLHFAYVAVGLAVMLGIVTFHSKRPWSALASVALMTITASITAMPWLLRSIIVSGQIPGMAIATQSLTRAQGEAPAVMHDLARFGFGRSPIHLVRSLFDITMYSAQFDWPPTRYGPFGGLIGFVLLGLLPLLAFAFPARGRRALALLAGGGAAFVLWFYTAQYLRYSLPILAIFCVLAGAAYVTAVARTERRTLRVFMTSSLLVLVCCGVGVQLQVPAMGRDFVVGRENKEQYLRRNLICCSGYPVIQLLNAEPQATRVLSAYELAQLYTPTQVSPLQITRSPLGSTADEATLLQLLDEGGYSHIVIDRNRLVQGWESQTVFGEGFLRRNTDLVGGEQNVYLYRLRSATQRGVALPWAAGRELLPNSVLTDQQDGVPSGWRTAGPLNGNVAGLRDHVAVYADHQGELTTTVAVVPQRQYLLSHTTKTDNGDIPSKAYLALTWLNAAGEPIGVSQEIVPVSTRDYHQFSMLATAPPAAATAIVSLEAEEGTVWFNDISLRAILPDDVLSGQGQLVAP